MKTKIESAKEKKIIIDCSTLFSIILINISTDETNWWEIVSKYTIKCKSISFQSFVPKISGYKLIKFEIVIRCK